MRKVEADVARNAQSVRRILSDMSLTISSPTAGLVVSRAVVISSGNNASMTPTTFASSSFTLVLWRKKKRLVKAQPRDAQSGTLPGKTSANKFSDARAKYEIAGSSGVDLSGPQSEQRHELPP